MILLWQRLPHLQMSWFVGLILLNTSIEHRLFRFLHPGERGRNVFKLTNNSFTENQPGDMTTVAVHLSWWA
jgi:hypothetical protein